MKTGAAVSIQDARQQPCEAHWRTAVVVEADDDRLQVRDLSDERILPVRRAFSCLIRPCIGDRVSLYTDETGVSYLTAILEREDTAGGEQSETRLEMPGQLTLAAESLRLHSGQTMQLQSPRLEAQVDEVNWLSRLFRMKAGQLLATTGVGKLIGELTELITRKSHFNAEYSFRNVSEAEHLRTGVYDLKAREMANIRANCAVVKGKELVKIDGDQVHVG